MAAFSAHRRQFLPFTDGKNCRPQDIVAVFYSPGYNTPLLGRGDLLRNAFFTVGNGGFAGFADLDLIAVGFQFVQGLYAVALADGA
jgi:hypothetical protein